MLKRKIAELIEEHLRSGSERILLIDGARQVGKTYIIRHVGKKLFPNFIEINMLEDSIGDRLFVSQLQNRFHVSASEIDEQDTHQIIVIGVAAVAPHNALADNPMDEISQFMETATDAQLLEETREIR